MIAAVYGSPRKQGNTEILMDAFLEQVEKSEEVKRFYLRDMTLKPCIECGGCDKTGVCVFKDDISGIYDYIENASSLIISSPIFFASVPAQVKAFIDRSQPFWARKYVLGQKSSIIRKGFFICVGAINTDKYFKSSKLVVQSYLNVMDIKYEGELFFPGVDAKGEIENVPGALEQARQSGINFTVRTPERNI